MAPGAPIAFPVTSMPDGMDARQMKMMQSAMTAFTDIFDPRNFVGVDLWRFDDAESRAVPESISGVGNNSSYGIRTMIPDDQDGLLLGMANPMNLLTCDNLEKSINNGLGGWSVVCLTSSTHFNVPTLGQWGLIFLALTLLIVGLIAIKSRSSIKA